LQTAKDGYAIGLVLAADTELSLHHQILHHTQCCENNQHGERMIILLIVLILVFGFGGYRLGPGLGYYGGGGVGTILLIVLILYLLHVI
jgi:hypothetical protein